MSGAIQTLPDHLLLNIMRMLPFHTRREVVPLVCKRWSQVVRSCSYLWPALLVDFVYECFGVDVMSENVEPKHVRNMSSRSLLRWLRMRELDVQALRIFGSSVEGVTHDFLDDSVSQLLETVTCSVQELSLEAAQDIIALPSFFNALPKLSCMRSLELKNIATPILDAQAVGLARLTGLQELIMEVDAGVEPSAATERFPGLQSFPPELCELSQLRTLSLGGHRISGLPDEFTVLTNLQQLLIDHCPMTNVCPKISSLTGLTTLVLEGTLDFLQNPYRNELGNLTGLRCLNLNSAGLPAIPSFITTLTNLELLEFDRNDMSSRDSGPNFPPEMTELTQLTRITMAQCRLSEFGRVLCSMPSLRVIDMTDNELLDAAMPPEILQLTNLTALGLSCNLLRRIPPVLMQLTSLRELYLEDNPAFQVVDPLDAFLDFPHLQVVAVGKNDLHAHGAWTSQSLAHVADFCRRLGQRSQPELRLTM